MRRTLALPGVTLAVWAVSLSGVATSARAERASQELEAAPAAVSSAQAIAFLNQQRALNGIPGHLVEQPAMSQGCWNHSNIYVDRRGQYPHTELAGQPGYTEAGRLAASRSNLATGGRGFWNGTTANPWESAPLHLYDMFAPDMTIAWYGEEAKPGSRDRACMGTGVDLETPAAVPAGFYSVPGNGRTGVVPNYTAGEDPWTPGEAVGLKGETGPYILLYPHQMNVSSVAAAVLTDSTGAVAEIKVVTPDTPAPPMPPGWPEMRMKGYYVIPVKPLRADTDYTLAVTWLGDNETAVQTVAFRTGPKVGSRSDVGKICPPDVCLRGSLTLTTTNRTLRIHVDPAGGRTAKVRIMRGKRQCAGKRRPCPKRNRWFLGVTETRRTVKLRRATTTIALPPRSKGLDALWVSVDVMPFRARGRSWSGMLTLTDYTAR